MKEIIYLDTDLMNSMLAQLDEGLINSFSLEQSNQKSESAGQQSVRGKSAGLKGQVEASTGFFPGGGLRLNASIGNNGTESTNESTTILEGQKDVLNKAFHDHALEVLTRKLNEKNLLCKGDQLNEGDLYLEESRYRFYDFALLKKAIDPDTMKEILLFDANQLGISYETAKKIIDKPKPNAREREMMETAYRVVSMHKQIQPIIDLFKQMNTFSNLASNLLEDLSVIKASDKIGLLKKKYLRESPEALSFRTDNSRKVKLLMRVIGKKERVYTDGDMPNFKENDLDIIPNLLLDIILGSFSILKEGDLIVTPIAIYYE